VLRFGEVHCGNCALDFRAEVFEPPERAPARVRVLDSATSACARHGRNAAVAACETCGVFMCGLCRVESRGRVICAACFDRERVSAEEGDTFVSWRTLGAYSSVAAVFLWPFSVIFGPFAIFAAIRGWLQDRRRGDAHGFTAALTLAAALCGILFSLSIMLNFFGRQKH
jgi:hypothetical protein